MGGTLYPSSAPAGAPAAPGRSASPCFAAESARGGTLMSLPEGIATPAVRGTRLGASGGAVSSVVTSGCPKRSEGGFPVGTRTVTSASSAQQEEICGAPPLLSEGRNGGEHRGNHDGGSAGRARHGLDLLIPGRWGRRRCSGCPRRAQHREGYRAARWVVCSDSAHLGTQPCCGGLRVAKRAEHPGFHVIGVMAVKCPLTGVLSDQVGDYGFTAAEKDGVLA